MKKITLTSLFSLAFSLGMFAQTSVSDVGENNPQIFIDQSMRDTQEACDQMQVSNAFENALFMEAGGQLVANDFIVDPLVDFTVTTLTANIFSQGGIASMDVIFYDDNAGLPGTELMSFTGIVPDSQTIVGSNFGFDVHETVLTIPNPVFSGGVSATTFWVQLIGTPTTGGTQLAWEVTSLGSIGNDLVFDNGAGVFDYSVGNDGVFTIEGDCLQNLNETPELAIAISCGETYSGATTGAVNSGGNDAGDVFYTYTGPGYQEDVTPSLCNGNTTFDSFLRVYDSADLSNEIGSNDNSCGDQSELTFTSDGTTTYYIMVEGAGTEEGDFELEFTCPTPARVQAIHNSADLAAEVVDVYVNDALAIDDFTFRTATPFIDLAADIPLTIAVAPSTSASSAEAIYSTTVMLDQGETYVIVADGIVSDAGYVPLQPFGLEIFPMGRESAMTAGNIDVLVHHGATDAPTVDVVETSVPAGTIVDDASYTDFAGYLELPAGDYVVDVTTADQSAVVATYVAPLASLGLADAAITVVASGFLDPSQNSDGAAFGLWVALPGGGDLVELLSPATNDAVCDAIALTVDATSAGDAYSNIGATGEAGEVEGSCFDSGINASVWFTFEAPASGNVRVTTDIEGATLTDTEIAIYEAPTDCADASTLGAELGCDQDSGTVVIFNSIVDLTGLTEGAVYYVQVDRWGTATDGTFGIEVLDLGACLPPSDLDAGNFTQTSADLSWTESDMAMAWNIEWGEAGFTQGSGTTVAVTDNPYTLDGLTGETDYEYYVQADCDGSTSEWIGPFAFTTLGTPPANDTVCDAIALTVGDVPAGDTYTDIFATAQAGEIEGSCFDGGINGSVWFTFVAPASGEAVVSTDIAGGTHEDTEIAIYEAPSDCADASTMGAEVGCDQDSGEIVVFNSIVNLTGLTEGATYYIQVDRWGTSDPGTFGISVVDPTLSTESFNDAAAFNYFPNPTDGILSLRAQNLIQNVSVINMLGQEVMRALPNAASNDLDVTSLRAGTYFVRVTIAGVTKTIKIIRN